MMSRYASCVPGTVDTCTPPQDLPLLPPMERSSKGFVERLQSRFACQRYNTPLVARTLHEKIKFGLFSET